jgi:hypothetical protein
MRRRRIFLAVLLLICLLVLVLFHKVHGPERWAVKVGRDPDSAKVNLTPKMTTIAEMVQWTPPSKTLTSHRVGIELQVFTVRCILRKFILATDHDVHMQLVDESGNSIVAEIPDPVLSRGSRFKPQITQVRNEFLKRYHLSSSWQVVNAPMTVTGVGFWDFYGIPVFDLLREKLERSSGVAPNQIELHPVLNIDFTAKTQSHEEHE